MSKVSIGRCQDVWSFDAIREALENVLAPLGGMEAFVRPGQRVMLKPNLVLPAPKETGTATHPLLIKAAALMAMEAGAGKVVIADNCGVGFNLQESYDVTGAQGIADELGIEIFNPSRETVELPFPNHPAFDKVRVGKEALEYDVLINMPVMKTHMHTTVSLCLKNLKGCIHRSSMKALHIGGVDYGLGTLATILKPALNILDGTIGQEGMGPITGGPKVANCLLASRDPFAADIIACRIMDVDPKTIRHLSYASQTYGWPLDWRDYEIEGIPLEEAVCPFEMPPSSLDEAFGVHVVEKDACTGCNAAVLAAINRLKNSGDLDLLDDCTVVVGQSAKVPAEGCRDKVLLVGKCMEGQREKGDLFIPGCPPPGWAIMGDLYSFKGREMKDDFSKNRMEIYRSESADQDGARYEKKEGVQ